MRFAVITAVLALAALNAPAQQNGDRLSLEKSAPTSGSRDAAATIVVFNENDRDSAELARFYAENRGIEKSHVIALNCPAKEDITREEYDRTIAEPLRKAFSKRGWWRLREADHPLGPVEKSVIRFVAVMRGVPLKIGPAFGYEGDKAVGPAAISTRNEAAVDSELAALGWNTRSISGALSNPYFRSFAPIAEANVPALLLVSRLDGPTPDMVKRMIIDSIAAEQTGLRGFAYLDARGLKDGGHIEGDKWIHKIAADARRRGTPVILDNGEGMFPVPYPMRHAALYFGWYAENVGGPMTRPDFRFVPGAVAVHIHSFSATTLRDPRRFWCGPLVTAGAAATLGNVFEPYLALTPHLDVFHERLRAGFTFAESAWSSQRVLSWVNTVIGDPLYRPYKTDNDVTAERPRGEWDEYAAGAKLWFEDQGKGETQLVEAAKRLRSGMIMEGLGLLLISDDQQDEAVKFFGDARLLHTHQEDVMRVAIHEVIQLRALGKLPDALALVRKQLELFPKTQGADVLRMLESDMLPKPATPAPGVAR